VVFDEFNAVVLDENEGLSIARSLANNKAAILQNHGLLTVGETVESAGTPILIAGDVTAATHKIVGSENTGHFSFLPIFNVLMAEQPELFD
jgi:hypothetical protein